MKFAPTPLFLPLIVMVAAVFQPTVAQSNPSPLVKRSDSAVKMLRSWNDRFSCAPQIAEKRIAFTRYEIASAVSACSDRVNEIAATATSDSLSRSDLENLQQLRSTFSLEIDQNKTPGLQSLPVVAPDSMVTTAQLEALERNQFSTSTKIDASVVFPESSNQKSIAQANPTPLIKRSDTIFQQWKLVRDKFGCVDLPWTPIPNPGFSRHEMAAAINTCFDRVSEFVDGTNLAGMNGLPAASPEDAKTLEPLLTEFAAEIATLRGREATVSDLAARKIVVYTPSGRKIMPYKDFAWHWPEAPLVFSPDSGEVLTTPQKPAPRPIDAWIVPALKELQSRYGCPNSRIQIANSSDLSRTRYEVAAIINTCAESYAKRGIKLRKIDAADFLGMQQAFAEELMTLQERHREVQRQKCLVNRCE